MTVNISNSHQAAAVIVYATRLERQSNVACNSLQSSLSVPKFRADSDIDVVVAQTNRNREMTENTASRRPIRDSRNVCCIVL